MGTKNTNPKDNGDLPSMQSEMEKVTATGIQVDAISDWFARLTAPPVAPTATHAPAENKPVGREKYAKWRGEFEGLVNGLNHPLSASLLSLCILPAAKDTEATAEAKELESRPWLIPFMARVSAVNGWLSRKPALPPVCLDASAIMQRLAARHLVAASFKLGRNRKPSYASPVIRLDDDSAARFWGENSADAAKLVKDTIVAAVEEHIKQGKTPAEAQEAVRRFITPGVIELSPSTFDPEAKIEDATVPVKAIRAAFKALVTAGFAVTGSLPDSYVWAPCSPVTGGKASTC